MNGKQCWHWSGAAFCGEWRGSLLFAQACLTLQNSMAYNYDNLCNRLEGRTCYSELSLQTRMHTTKIQTNLHVRMAFIVALDYTFVFISPSQSWQSLTSRVTTIQTTLPKCAGRFGNSVFSHIRDCKVDSHYRLRLFRIIVYLEVKFWSLV